MKITYLGHSSISIETKDKTLLIDPFISGNKLAGAIDINRLQADYILDIGNSKIAKSIHLHKCANRKTMN